MSKKKVLIVEDGEALGVSLSEQIENLGYEVLLADKVITAQALASQYWEEIDVAVFDMRLEDADDPTVTGAAVGISMRENRNSFPPEFLIYSAFADEKDYYQMAIELGVAAYLSKEEYTSTDLIRYIKVLALRRALNASNPRNADKLTSIAGESRSLPDLVTKFCKEILEPEFDTCLKVPFVVLFGGKNNQTYNCADNAELPKGANSFYHAVQTYTHGGNGDSSIPFKIDIDSMQVSKDELPEEISRKLNGAFFIPVSVSKDVNLSIGILHDSESENPNEAQALIKILQKYLRDTLYEQVHRLWSQWEQYRILTIQSNTAKFCGFVGQEIKILIEEEDQDLLELADDLIDTGGVLWNSLAKKEKSNDSISVKDLVADTWSWIEESLNEDSQKLPSLRNEKNCQISANREDLEVAFARLLHWLAQRAAATPADVEPSVTIECERVEDEIKIVFEDKSRRLDSKLRAEIFSPLTQAVPVPFDNLIKQGNSEVSGKYLPLFLAKTLVPSLTDCSDDADLKDKPYGHRFTMHFPVAESSGKAALSESIK